MMNYRRRISRIVTGLLMILLMAALSVSVSADNPGGDGLEPDNLLSAHPILGSQLGAQLQALDGRQYAAGDAARIDSL